MPEQPDGDPGPSSIPDGESSLPEPVEAHDDAGLDLARSIARGLAGSTPARARRMTGTGRARKSRGRAGSTLSGAHPDGRDPQTLDSTLSWFVEDHGWGTELRVHGVFSRWETIVGAEVGQHVRPESFADGRLVVRTDSTAWATQMKLLAADVVRRLNQVLGDGTVEVIDVRGPNAPSWSRGRYRVRGRGPRDTFG